MIMEQLLNRPEKEKKRVRLTVAYDGTNYHGWQIQNNGITIESELNRCLTDLLRELLRSLVPAGQIPVCMHWGISLCLTLPAGCLRRKFLMR